MADKAKKRLHELETLLRSVNESFDRDMRARGFDPAQAETSALPSHLAELYLERQSLLEELSELESAETHAGSEHNAG